MEHVRHTLVSDGATDANLLPIIDWTLRQVGGNPSGSSPLDLLRLTKLESLPDPKKELERALKLDPAEFEERVKIRLYERQQREASMQIPPKDLYEIYQRLSKEAATRRLPITLDDIQKAVYGSKHSAETHFWPLVNTHPEVTVH